MPISFNQINPSRVPGAAVEISAARAAQASVLQEYNALIIGQKLAAGTQAANTVISITSEAQAVTLCGRGSQLHRMARAWFRNNQSTRLFLGVLADDGAGVAASCTVTVTGPATAAGTLPLYIGGDLVSVAVNASDSANTIAAAINAAINANLDLPVTSAVSTNVVTITSRHKGLSFNGFDVRAAYQATDAIPAGVGVTITAMANGTTAPALATLISAMGDVQYNVIAHPYTDATSLTALEAELTSRFGPARMLDGVAITASAETHGNLITLGNGRNSPHSVIFATNRGPTAAFEFAAATAAVIAFYGAQDPARPFETLPLTGVLGPAESARFTKQERELLLADGISTAIVVAGTVQLERAITTYQVNASGVPDTAYLDLTTMLTLGLLRWSFRNRIRAKFARHKVADDTARFGTGQSVATPAIVKAECIAWFRDMEALGLVEDFDQFKRDVVVERNTDPTRIDILLPPNIVNPLIQTATKLEFRL
jgi:phage tail sheath gpL-like